MRLTLAKQEATSGPRHGVHAVSASNRQAKRILFQDRLMLVASQALELDHSYEAIVLEER
jgi:hypothetical protein